MKFVLLLSEVSMKLLQWSLRSGELIRSFEPPPIERDEIWSFDVDEERYLRFFFFFFILP